MDQTETYSFAQTYGLVKWKRTPTYDVLIQMKDLCHLDGTPRYSDRVLSHYVEYSERKRAPVRRPFMTCQIPKEQRRRLWAEKMAIHRSATLCVECYSDRGRWVILRGRPEKKRSNSGRTIRDTWWLERECITLPEIIQTLHSDNRVLMVPSLAPVTIACADLQWIAWTWTQSTEPCELELRLTHNGTSSIPPEIYHRLVRQLRADKTMHAQNSHTVDYTCGPIRVTRSGDTLQAIEKELGTKHDIRLPNVPPPFGLRCALSYEHRAAPVYMQGVLDQFSTCRKKHRWRFVHHGTIAIDCTHVQQTKWSDDSDQRGQESYEIEIELLARGRYADIARNKCDGLILSMVWRMLWYVLGISEGCTVPAAPTVPTDSHCTTSVSQADRTIGTKQDTLES
jgi:hypothetical protein